ncbi:histidine phosphatase family protein [Luteimicrobium subarcticum]|uniref:Putative phosphoglycerate mutase n=1 Tax=Luteimicrobium subarcticum TaxID=620910 RepID=A0A2M8WRG2_9MICO|nr:histidine phosphatase family protein [Luteimicrobium subarcticum]PJI93436.1 putative phosphoglycerate mutase [Luteimicrobium subarcticum]
MTAAVPPTGGRAPRPSGATVRLDGVEPLTVVLVRHGVTPLTQVGAFSGSSVPGPGLAPAGRVQAAQAADRVRRVGRDTFPDLPRVSQVVASPMVRTQETAAALGRRLGLHVATDARFAELAFGEYEELVLPDVRDRDPEWVDRFYGGDAEVAAPGGESLLQLADRVEDGLADLVRGGTDRTVAVVTHAMVVRVAVGRALGVAPSRWTRLRIVPASLTVLRLWPDGDAEASVVGLPSDL